MYKIMCMIYNLVHHFALKINIIKMIALNFKFNLLEPNYLYTSLSTLSHR